MLFSLPIKGVVKPFVKNIGICASGIITIFRGWAVFVIAVYNGFAVGIAVA